MEAVADGRMVGSISSFPDSAVSWTELNSDLVIQTVVDQQGHSRQVPLFHLHPVALCSAPAHSHSSLV